MRAKRQSEQQTALVKKKKKKKDKTNKHWQTHRQTLRRESGGMGRDERLIDRQTDREQQHKKKKPHTHTHTHKTQKYCEREGG